MESVSLLRGVPVFDGLNEAELKQVAAICREATFVKGNTLTTQGTEGNEMYIIQSGLLEVQVGHLGSGLLPPHTVVNWATARWWGKCRWWTMGRARQRYGAPRQSAGCW
jgi:hypothetical protein